MTLRSCSMVAALALAVGCPPAFAAGPGGGGGGGGAGGGGGGAGGGGATAPTVINYKITGTTVAPFGCLNGVHPGFEEACTAFPTGTPYTLTFSVNTGVKPNTQNSPAACVDFSTTEFTRTIAQFSRAVSNINLQLANGISYVGSGDVALENDTCLTSGVTATDSYNISAKMTGPNSFPSFSGGTATVGFVFQLAEVASAVDANHPLPPAALQSLNLPDAHPEAHLLQDTSQQSILTFRFPNVGAVSWAVGLPISTFEVVP